MGLADERRESEYREPLGGRARGAALRRAVRPTCTGESSAPTHRAMGASGRPRPAALGWVPAGGHGRTACPESRLRGSRPHRCQERRLCPRGPARTGVRDTRAVLLPGSRLRRDGGGRWWSTRLRRLLEAAGRDAVGKSTKYRPLGVTLPSQRYSFDIVRQAIARGQEIVVMRSRRLWIEAVPELERYPFILSNNQNPHLSPTQLGDAQFERLARALSGR